MTTKKPHSAQEARANYGHLENRTDSGSILAARPITEKESDAFVARLREIIGDESVSAFARRCSVGEGTIRNILAGAWPRTDNLIAIADAANVTVDWLATGRLPKTRAELRNGQAAPAVQPLDPARLRMALTITEDSVAATGQTLTADQRANMVLAVYQRLNKGESS